MWWANMFQSSASSTSPPRTPESADGTEAGAPEPPKLSAISSYFTNLADTIVNVPPYLGRARVPQVCKWRDKEGLLSEIIVLKDTIENSAIHLAEHRHEYIRRLAENRRLERRVEELELRGNFDAPRSGGVVRLEARAKGLEGQYNLLTDVVASRKHGELYELSRDLCATKTRVSPPPNHHERYSSQSGEMQETEVERDTYAAEIVRLKILVQHLKLLYHQAQEEHSDFIMCKKHLEKLIVLNPKLQQTLENLQECIKKAKADIKAQKAKGNAASSAVKKWESKYSSLQSQVQSLNSQLTSTEKDRQKRQRKFQQLGFERMQFNRQFKQENPNVMPAS